MENKKQTAVEWLIEELKKNEYLGTFCTADAFAEEEKRMLSICEQAKAMEKEQIKDAYANGSNDRLKNRVIDYYNETYGGNI
jgi:hypothetical protein